MAHRLTKITTRTGDDGSTGLGDGSRVAKDALRIATLGEVDEFSSALGAMLAEALPADVAAVLRHMQNDLFDLGGEVSIPTHRMLGEEQVAALDGWIAQYNARLAPLQEFIIPGGTRGAALCHVARAVCRRAERSLVALARGGNVSANALCYLNRASDLLFILARCLNRDAGIADVLWKRGG